MKTLLTAVASLALLGLSCKASSSPNLPSWVSEIKEPSIPKKNFPITAHGAVPGETATKAIAAAIKQCAAAGGGRVVIPKGEWKSGPIHLRSKVNLHLEKGAILLFSDNPEDYRPLVLTRWAGIECYNFSPLIYAIDCEDIAITGSGEIDGNGKAWWEWKKSYRPHADRLQKMVIDGVPVKDRMMGVVGGIRPAVIQPFRCKRVLIEGVRVKSGPAWTVHPVYCRDLTIRGVTVATHGPNNDGIDPDSCERVLIEGCTVNTGDDSICIKSGFNEDGWRVGIPCQKVVVRKCKIGNGHGGIVIGSEIAGGASDIWAENLDFDGTDVGIRIKTARGRGGYIRDIHLRNITMRNIKGDAIQITAFYPHSTMPAVTQTPTVISDIAMENIWVESARYAGQIRGLLEEPIRRVSLKNSKIKAQTGLTVGDVTELDLVVEQLEIEQGEPIKNAQLQTK